MEFNKYQTPVEKLVYKRAIDDKIVNIPFLEAPKEVQEEFNEIIATVPMVQWLISKDRPNIKDLPKDEKGRAVWRIEYPPIIENTDYFRETAIHYQRTGRFTDLRPNGNPNSEYRKWVDRELDRIENGCLRPDGAWIPGYMYWFLNYCPIILTRKFEDAGDSEVGYRDVDFPEFWEGILWRYKGWDLARSLGLHFAEISKRGSSKSYTLASALSKIFVIGDRLSINPKKKTSARGVLMAYQKEFLNKDGTLNKFEDMIDFVAQNTEFPRKRLKSSINEMDWVMGYTDLNTGAKKGTGNEVLGVAVKDDPDKGRGKRASLIGLEEFGKFPNVAAVIKIAEPSVKDGDLVFGLMLAVGCVCAGTKVYTKAGKEVNIEDLKQEDGILGFDFNTGTTSIEDITYIQEPAYKKCVRITASGGVTLECSEDHPILTRITHTTRTVSYKIGERRNTYYEYKFIKAGDLKCKSRQAIVLGRGAIGTFGDYALDDPYLLGILIGDGSYAFDKTPRLSNCDSELLEYVKTKYETIVENSHITKNGKLYEEVRIKGICQMLRKEGLYGQVKTNKRLPTKYNCLTKDSAAKLLAGLFDTDGTIPKNRHSIELCSSSEDLLNQVKQLLLKFAIYSKIRRVKARIDKGRKDKHDWFSLVIDDISSIQNFSENIPILIGYKKDVLNAFIDKIPRSKIKNCYIALIRKVEDIGVQRIYNLTANNTHTYLANGIITHNTGGEEGSDFSGALDLIYHPSGSHFLSLENVWDKESQIRGTSIFCFPAYVNRKGCYNKDGISDVTKALYALCFERYIAKYENPDPMQVTRTKAENPVTLQDAIMKRDGAFFPVAQIAERLQEIDLNPNFFDNILVGDFTQSTSGKVEFKPTADTPIHKYNQKDNKIAGAFEIAKLPEYNREGKPYLGRYVAGLDPVDTDDANTMSFVSFFILDLWTDSIVCEWTGRLTFVDDCYEKIRLACMFYNAKLLYENNKKGLFAYFKRMNCLYLLAETPEFLKDKDFIKGSKIGNSIYGVNATNPINNYARELLKNWFLKPVTLQTEDEDTPEVTIPNVMTMWNRAALDEARQWNPDGNFDRISALGMLMLIREDRIVTFGDNLRREETPINPILEDPFFKRNYRPRLKKQ